MVEQQARCSIHSPHSPVVVAVDLPTLRVSRFRLIRSAKHGFEASQVGPVTPQDWAMHAGDPGAAWLTSLRQERCAARNVSATARR